MIIFVDDERWSISGFLLKFEFLQKKNPAYETKHFFYPTDALMFLEDNCQKVKLIIVDIKLDFNDKNFNNSTPGGIQLIKVLRENKKFRDIWILIYSIVSFDTIIKEIPNYNYKMRIKYLNRNIEDKIFFEQVDRFIKLRKNR
jgi:hypothetical protein